MFPKVRTHMLYSLLNKFRILIDCHVNLPYICVLYVYGNHLF